MKQGKKLTSHHEFLFFFFFGFVKKTTQGTETHVPELCLEFLSSMTRQSFQTATESAATVMCDQTDLEHAQSGKNPFSKSQSKEEPQD
jgi:hypothetical protein